MNILQAHAKVFLDLLDADNVPPALVVCNGRVDGEVPPYLLAYFRLYTPSGAEVPQLVSLEAASDVLDVWAYCHSIADTPTGALGVAGRGRAALLGKTPVIAGRVCGRIRHDDSRPTDRDESTGRAVFDQVDVYRFLSLPG